MLYSDHETVGLLGREDDEITVHDMTTERRLKAGAAVTPCGMLEHCDCGSLSCQTRDLQMPSSSKTIYESWTISYRRPRYQTSSWFSCLGAIKLWDSTTLTESGKVTTTTPQTQFDQGELAAAVDRAKEQYEPLTFVSRDYDGDLERRLRRLDSTVQDELYNLIRDRTEYASNSFRRREYKLAVLVGVPGGEMTDAGTESSSSQAAGLSWLTWGLGCGLKRRNSSLRDRRAASHVEYRVILRGQEVKTNDAGWGAYSRYAQPWKLADEAELANAKEKSEGYKTLLD